jgi:hypothetical protein
VVSRVVVGVINRGSTVFLAFLHSKAIASASIDNLVLVLRFDCLLNQYRAQSIATFLKQLTSVFSSYRTHVGKKHTQIIKQS